MTQNTADGVLVVGAGHAGVATAGALRAKGFDGPITLVGEESHLPYHRPPVSKGYLEASSGTGEGSAATSPLRAESWYRTQGIDLRRGVRVTGVDLPAGEAGLDDGSTVAFSHLVLATGARARELASARGITGCWSLRTFADSLAFREPLGTRRDIVLIGGGFVGLEVAAAARAQGCAVTVLEREQRLLQRVAGATVSQALTRIHRDRGVDIRTGVEVAEIEHDDNGGVSGVRLADGELLPCSALVVGIGADPNDGLARQLGVRCEGGIVVDSGCRTDVDRVYAVGDVTVRDVPGYPGRRRLESVPNTTEQANQVAATIVGAAPPRPEVPWFWSDQYEHKLQIAGLLDPCGTSVTRGDAASDGFAVYHYSADDRLVAVEAFNATRDFMAAKKWLGGRANPVPEQVGNLDIELRDLLTQERESDVR